MQTRLLVPSLNFLSNAIYPLSAYFQSTQQELVVGFIEPAIPRARAPYFSLFFSSGSNPYFTRLHVQGIPVAVRLRIENFDR